MRDFEEIVSKFQTEDELTEIRPLGQGTVNHTFEVVCGQHHYVLQEINHSVFKYPVEIMNNLFQVTEYLRKAIALEGGNPECETLTFIRTKAENQLLQTEDGNYYRMYRMVCAGTQMPKPQTKKEAFEAAAAVAKFHCRLAGFNVKNLSSTFPKLHDMRDAVKQLLDAVRADICFRTSNCQEQIHFVLDRSDRLGLIRDAAEAGWIPQRVTHNDAGYNNILSDEATGKAICLIDLDTVMAGSALYDFGNAVRMGAATVSEYEKSGDVELDLTLYRAYLEGYLFYMGMKLTNRERELLGYSVWFSAMEQGIRYLTDYLSGRSEAEDFSEDKLYLYCAVNQFFLVLDIEDKKEQMEQIENEVLMNMD